MTFDYGNFGQLGLVEYYIANLDYYLPGQKYEPNTVAVVHTFNNAMDKLEWNSPFSALM